MNKLLLDMDPILVLIKDIRSNPAIWNQFSKDYHNREITDQIWKELSVKYSSPVENLKAKWIGLRSQFRKLYLKQIKNLKTNYGKKITKNWKYFVPLLFLRNQMKKNAPKSSQSNSNPTDSDEDVMTEMNKEFDALEADYDEANLDEMINHSEDLYSKTIDISAENPTSNPTINSLLESFQKDFEKLEKEKAATIDHSRSDEDVLFLHSLLPFIKSLSFNNKLILRTKIQSLICNYITNLDDDYFNDVASYSTQKKRVVTADSENVSESNTIQIKILNNVASEVPVDVPNESLPNAEETQNPAVETEAQDISYLIDDLDESRVWLLNIAE